MPSSTKEVFFAAGEVVALAGGGKPLVDVLRGGVLVDSPSVNTGPQKSRTAVSIASESCVTTSEGRARVSSMGFGPWSISTDDGEDLPVDREG